MLLPFPQRASASCVSLADSFDAVSERLQQLLRDYDLLNTAWLGGYQSATPGTAFFFAYQAAMRRVDPVLSDDEIAAFVISERGMKSLRNMATELGADGCISGAKSHAMLAATNLNSLYVVARKGEDLVCCKVKNGDAGVSVPVSEKSQPFMPDLPHSPVCFDHTPCELFCDDAHLRLNKPFRFWEDVMGLLALSGWLCGQAESVSSSLLEAAESLAAAYMNNPDGYDLRALNAFDALFMRAEEAAAELPETAAQLWQRDKLLLVFTQPLRQKIRLSVQ